MAYPWETETTRAKKQPVNLNRLYNQLAAALSLDGNTHYDKNRKKTRRKPENHEPKKSQNASKCHFNEENVT